jgi:hypothetical protein
VKALDSRQGPHWPRQRNFLTGVTIDSSPELRDDEDSLVVASGSGSCSTTRGNFPWIVDCTWQQR